MSSRPDPGCRGRAAPDRPAELEARAPRAADPRPAAEANYSAEIQRSTVETNTDVVDSLAGLRAELLRLRRGIVEVAAADQHRDRRGRHRAQLGLRRLRADHHRTLRPDAGAVPAAGRRAADLRPADPRRGARPGPGRGDHAADRPRPARSCWPCRPARRSGTSRTAGTPASARWSGSAGRPPGRPAGSARPPSTTRCSPT